MRIPKRARTRMTSTIRRYCDVLDKAKSRDISEADTVTIVADMLSDVFGYDKYAEVTGEFAIRGTYCDLATRVDGEVKREALEGEKADAAKRLVSRRQDRPLRKRKSKETARLAVPPKADRSHESRIVTESNGESND